MLDLLTTSVGFASCQHLVSAFEILNQVQDDTFFGDDLCFSG